MNDHIDREIFEREIAMCRKFFKKNGGKCYWGECDACGVIPLLVKLHTGDSVEKEEEILQLKKKALETA